MRCNALAGLQGEVLDSADLVSRFEFGGGRRAGIEIEDAGMTNSSSGILMELKKTLAEPLDQLKERCRQHLQHISSFLSPARTVFIALLATLFSSCVTYLTPTVIGVVTGAVIAILAAIILVYGLSGGTLAKFPKKALGFSVFTGICSLTVLFSHVYFSFLVITRYPGQ
jgi:hypothetical protein